jgi:CRISPR-associated endonuclease/helicase Cas3
MDPLTLADFTGYFRELHGHAPYDWQARLARRVAEGTWPGAIDLPTGSGKTACLDIAVFALACQASWEKPMRTAPRRIFFCVNRRVIVDEAHQRAVRIARKTWSSEGEPSTCPVLARVAAALRRLSSMDATSGPPLDVLELRGGIYRDNRWARSATQPIIVCTTIDQLGSRLLFRGYGVSPNAAPIQAALIAYDSLVLLDEAHISRPFLQTLEFVKRYLNPERWAAQSLGVRPMVVVPMTATPPEGVNDSDVIRLEKLDREREGERTGLDRRLRAGKPAKLLSVRDVVEAAVAEAGSLANGSPTAVGIIVNRVRTARAIYEGLRARHPDTVVELVIGSMRPIDRDRQAERLRGLVGPDRPKSTAVTSFVVATQCLEVGADYDFDALVTECASLDALRQRFGRLNRGGRAIDARAVILIDGTHVREESQLDDGKPLDPIYGNALARTWNWLNAHAEVLHVVPDPSATTTRRRRAAAQPEAEIRRIDFGIDAFNATLGDHGENGRIPPPLLAPSASQNAPVMLPAYVDSWCQTSPRPAPEPEVSLFIHGPESGEPDVQVCWRADLVADGCLERSDWCDVVGLLPPTAAECMSVPISRLRRWLTDESDDPDLGDLLGTSDPPSTAAQAGKGRSQKRKRLLESRAGVLWRGARDSELIRSPDDLRPGDTLVLPASAGGWSELGHVPPQSPIDVAEGAFRLARDRAALRLHPALRSQLPDATAVTELIERIGDPGDMLTLTEIRRLLREAAAGPCVGEQAEALRNLADPRLGLARDSYPDDRGLVLTTRRRVESASSWHLPVADEGEDDRSRTSRELPVNLADHTRHVQAEVIRTVAALPFDQVSAAFPLAAELHDLGKADERFQAMLRRSDRTDAWLQTGFDSALLAKSDGMPQTRRQRREARERAGLPEGFRHEMLSVQCADRFQSLPADHGLRVLILHLIAAHHGFARPFAPVVIDTDPPSVAVNGIELAGTDRQQLPPHRIDSGIAERFWRLTRQYGWWGLAYLEAVLRLADQQASADEDAGACEPDSPSSALAGVPS